MFELDGVTPRITGPPRGNSAPLQNRSIFQIILDQDVIKNVKFSAFRWGGV